MTYTDALQFLADRAALLVLQSCGEHPVLAIINVAAGTAARHRQVVRKVAAMQPVRREESHRQLLERWLTTVWTDSPDILEDVLHRWIDPMKRTVRRCAPLVITLGGDGTHNAVMQAGYRVSRDLLYLRLPLGSGNDAVPMGTLEEVFAALEEPITPRWIPSIEVWTARGRQYRGFNVASLGIDAWVTALHHRLRRRLPGNTYRIIATPALLFYESIVKLQDMTVMLENGADITGRRVMIVALGVSGHRTYGDHIAVLPDHRNLCVLFHAGLRGKLAMKKRLLEGTHTTGEYSHMAETTGVEIRYNGRIPLQVDGEAVWLEREDFPVTLRLQQQTVQTIEPHHGSGE